MGFFGLLVSHTSMATPMTQTQTPPQKIEQIEKKKHNLVERIIYKRLKKQFKNDEKPINKARLCLIMGALSLPLLVLGFLLWGYIARIGLIFALISVLLGIQGLRKYPKNTRKNKFSRIGLIWGAITLGIYAIFISIYLTAYVV